MGAVGSVECEVAPSPDSSLPSCPIAKPMSGHPLALTQAQSRQAGSIQTATAMGEISKVKGLAID